MTSYDAQTNWLESFIWIYVAVIIHLYMYMYIQQSFTEVEVNNCFSTYHTS